MQKLKRFSLVIVTFLLVVSCGPYQKVLNKGKPDERYKMATDMYNKGEYAKALTLFEKVLPVYTGKPQMERIQFMMANSYYKTKSYSLSGYHFRRFVNNYPKSSKREEALFLSAKGYYFASPKYSLDQTDTHKAIDVLQEFINSYPNSDKLKEANDIYVILSRRLEKKYFEISKQYLDLEKYNAAIVSFDNFLEDFPGTIYKEETLYLKFKASFELGIKSVESKKEERIKNALSYYKKFLKVYPESKFIKKIKDSKGILEEQLQALIKQTK
jgi:outer membrane protein assembly factor BamD